MCSAAEETNILTDRIGITLTKISNEKIALEDCYITTE